MKYIFFTDLDGTLLDFDSYSFDLSQEGIDILASRNIPLVSVSSKTFYEMTVIMSQIGLHLPFAFENGAGIAMPSGEGYKTFVYGPGIDKIYSVIRKIESLMGGKVTLLGEMAVEDIASFTGLSPFKANLAKKRMASAPFLIDRNSVLSEKEICRINRELKSYELKLTMGGRFYHVIPMNRGKDQAVEEITKNFNNEGRFTILSAGVGDGVNDIPMLQAVDYPFLVRRPGGSHIVTPFKVHITDGVGPAGFSEAVKKFMNIIQD